MVRALGIGVGVGNAGVSIRQAWQFIPIVYTKAMYKSPSHAKPSNRSFLYIPPISAKLRVTMSLPKFSPAKILENIIFSIRFKKPDTDVDQNSGENRNLGSRNSIVDGQIAERERLIESIQEETRRAGIVEPPESLGDRGEEITSVTKDTLNPSILWERREKDVQAERERRSFKSPGFSFSAAGLLFPYHLGVCQCLLENGYITVCMRRNLSFLSFLLSSPILTSPETLYANFDARWCHLHMIALCSFVLGGENWCRHWKHWTVWKCYTQVSQNCFGSHCDRINIDGKPPFSLSFLLSLSLSINFESGIM